MAKRRKLLLLGALATAAVIAVGSMAVVAFAANPKVAQVQYSAPFVCGWVPPDLPANHVDVKPGNYATAIDIHNHTDFGVAGSMRVALHYKLGEAWPPRIPLVNFGVANRRVLELDCADIWAAAKMEPGTFVKGAIRIGLSEPLAIAGIYTSQTHNNDESGPDAGAGHSIDVEWIPPMQSPIDL